MTKGKGFRIPKRCLDEKKIEEAKSFNVLKEIERIDIESNKEPWTRKVGGYHPSSLHPNACKRALWYDRTGEAPKSQIPHDLRMIFDMGHALHDMLQGKLEKEFDSFESEVPVSAPELHIVGHCDGVFRDTDWVLEIKTVGESVFSSLIKPKKEHIYQIHCYMYALDIPRCQLLYVARATGKMRMFKVEFDKQVFDEVLDIINTVEDHIEEGTVPHREVNKWVCRTCKFLHVCEPFKERVAGED